jgi:hypothetical protein
MTVLDLTPEHAAAARRFDEWQDRLHARLYAKRLLRPDRREAANRGVKTKRDRAQAMFPGQGKGAAL